MKCWAKKVYPACRLNPRPWEHLHFEKGLSAIKHWFRLENPMLPVFYGVESKGIAKAFPRSPRKKMFVLRKHNRSQLSVYDDVERQSTLVKKKKAPLNSTHLESCLPKYAPGKLAPKKNSSKASKKVCRTLIVFLSMVFQTFLGACFRIFIISLSPRDSAEDTRPGRLVFFRIWLITSTLKPEVSMSRCQRNFR